MFDVLLGLSAIVNAAVEAVAVKEANKIGTKGKPNYLKTDYDRALEFYEEREAETENMSDSESPAPRKYESVWDRKRKKFHEREAKRRYEERHRCENKEPENPLAIWVVEHDDMILGILKPGVHIIPGKELDGLDPDMVAEFLFKTETVEKVEIVPEGLEVTVR